MNDTKKIIVHLSTVYLPKPSSFCIILPLRTYFGYKYILHELCQTDFTKNSSFTVLVEELEKFNKKMRLKRVFFPRIFFFYLSLVLIILITALFIWLVLSYLNELFWAYKILIFLGFSGFIACFIILGNFLAFLKKQKNDFGQFEQEIFVFKS